MAKPIILDNESFYKEVIKRKDKRIAELEKEVETLKKEKPSKLQSIKVDNYYKQLSKEEICDEEED